MPLNTPSPDFLTSLEMQLPGVVHEVTPAYLEESRGQIAGIAAALLKPRSTADVSAILRTAANARVGIIPFGGGTGLVGGQVSQDDPPCLILSLARMKAVREVSGSDRSMVVEAGCTLANTQAAAEAENLLFPLSLASEGTASIGGNLATNAGGVNVIRWGNTRELCLGIEAVFANGDVMHGLKSLRKDNTGYDLRHLLIGSEGSLGVITAARLKLFPRPVEKVTALLQVENPAAALTVLRQLQDQFGETISAFELIDRIGIDFLSETLPDLILPPTGTAKWLILVEFGTGANTGLNTRVETALAALFETGLLKDGFLSQNETQSLQIWAMRESIPEGNRRVGSIASHDISIPISRLPEFIDEAHGVIRRIDPSLRINSFGHLGDGNLHYNIFPPKGRAKGDYHGLKSELTRAVHDLCAGYDGSISAEHGIGRFKREDLQRYGDPTKLAAMAAIKGALDPLGIMNPGAVIEVPTG